MSKALVPALLWGGAVALYLRFGLEPTGWMFYELSHLSGIDWLYWGYTGFRGGGYAFGLWQGQDLVCLLAGVLVAGLVWWRKQRRMHA